MELARNTARLLGGVALGSAIMLAGCVAEPYPQQQLALASAPAGACNSCGVITAIQGVYPDDYRVTLRMDNGGIQTLDQETQPAFRVGDRVEILSRTATPAYPPQ